MGASTGLHGVRCCAPSISNGYRSLRDFRLRLGRVTVVTGENGVGKSNVYRALGLMRKMAEGRFASAVSEEGGLPSLLWAGKLKKNETRRMRWEIEHEDLHIEMECGMIPATPGDPSLFKTDPDIKLETLRHGGKDGRVMAKRKGPAIDLRGNDGKMLALPLPVHATESMLSEVRDGAHYPAVLAARETLLSWRFYYHFATDARSPRTSRLFVNASAPTNSTSSSKKPSPAASGRPWMIWENSSSASCAPA